MPVSEAAPKSKYLTKPLLVLCLGGPMDGKYLRFYGLNPCPPSWGYGEAPPPGHSGKYRRTVLGEGARQPRKGAVQEFAYQWESA